MTLENNAKTILKGSSIRSGTIAPQTATNLGTWHAERRLRQFPPSPVLFRLEHNDLSKMTKGSSRVPCALSTTIWLTNVFQTILCPFIFQAISENSVHAALAECIYRCFWRSQLGKKATLGLESIGGKAMLGLESILEQP